MFEVIDVEPRQIGLGRIEREESYVVVEDFVLVFVVVVVFAVLGGENVVSGRKIRNLEK